MQTNPHKFITIPTFFFNESTCTSAINSAPSIMSLLLYRHCFSTFSMFVGLIPDDWWIDELIRRDAHNGPGDAPGTTRAPHVPEMGPFSDRTFNCQRTSCIMHFQLEVIPDCLLVRRVTFGRRALDQQRNVRFNLLTLWIMRQGNNVLGLTKGEVPFLFGDR